MRLSLYLSLSNFFQFNIKIPFFAYFNAGKKGKREEKKKQKPLCLKVLFWIVAKLAMHLLFNSNIREMYIISK